MNFKLKLVQAWTTVVTLYTSGRRDGWRHSLLHAFTCFFISLVFCSLLFMALQLNAGPMVSGLMAGSFCLLMSTVLVFSKTFRCFILLLLISCTMKQGRDVLLATGAGLGVLLSIRNIYGNLLEVSRSIACNLEKKKELLEVSPIDNYLQMMYWVRAKLKTFSNMGIVKFEAQMFVSSRLESAELKDKLEQVRVELENRADRAEAAFGLVMSIVKKVAPLMGIILLVVSAVLFLKKFTRNKKYKNAYITSRFVEFDERQKAKGKPHVLPLSKEEARHYIFIPRAKPSLKECWPVAKFFIPVGSYILAWFFFMGLDKLLHWTISIISRQLLALEPIYVPLKVSVYRMTSILSIPVSDTNSRMDFSFSVVMFESECAPQPTLLLSSSLVPLLVVVIVLVLLGLLSAKLLQFQMLVSERFFTDSINSRVKHLHNKILRKRSKQNFTAMEQARFQSLKKDVKFWFPILDFCRLKDRYSQQLRNRH